MGSLSRTVRRNYDAMVTTRAKEAAVRQGVPWCKTCNIPGQDLYDTSHDYRVKNKITHIVARGLAWRCFGCNALWVSKDFKARTENHIEKGPDNESDRSVSDDRPRSKSDGHLKSDAHAPSAARSKTNRQRSKNAEQ